MFYYVGMSLVMKNIKTVAILILCESHCTSVSTGVGGLLPQFCWHHNPWSHFTHGICGRWHHSTCWFRQKTILGSGCWVGDVRKRLQNLPCQGRSAGRAGKDSETKGLKDSNWLSPQHHVLMLGGEGLTSRALSTWPHGAHSAVVLFLESKVMVYMM
jgi:hypothetical protein